MFEIDDASSIVVGNTSMEPLSWNRRMGIAVGVARGLAFLHNSDKQIIYRDFKASNILLDVVLRKILCKIDVQHKQQSTMI